MAVSNATLKSGGTVSVAGGTDLAFASLGIQANQNTLYAIADPDFRTRREIVCAVKPPKAQAGAPNGFTQARASTLVKVPLVLDNGKMTYNTLRIELAVDVETSDAEKTELMSLGSQILADADFSAFFKSLSVA